MLNDLIDEMEAGPRGTSGGFCNPIKVNLLGNVLRFNVAAGFGTWCQSPALTISFIGQVCDIIVLHPSRCTYTGVLTTVTQCLILLMFNKEITDLGVKKQWRLASTCLLKQLEED